MVQVAGVPVRLGVVDYGGSSSYLLVPGVDPERLATATAVLKALETTGAVHILHPQSSPSPSPSQWGQGTVAVAVAVVASLKPKATENGNPPAGQ